MHQNEDKTLTITFNENSKLAQVCDKIIHLKLKRPHIPTAGFGSFVANAVTYLQVAAIPFPKKFDIWYQNAVKISNNVLESVVSKRDFINWKNLKVLSIR